jgi:hypothetical protein
MLRAVGNHYHHLAVDLLLAEILPEHHQIKP